MRYRDFFEETSTSVDLLESVNDRGIFKAVFFAGIPGAGKSYVLNKISDGGIMPRVVNTDIYTEYLSKKFGRDISGEFDVHVDVIKKVTVNQLSGYVNGALPLFVDGTSNSASSLFKREGILKSFGYDTGMVYIDTDLDVAIERSKERDRKVPEEFIRKVYESLSKNREYYKNHFEFFVEVKNSDGELTDKVVMDAYKKVRGFYSSDIQNPIGIESKNKMVNGYLVPSVYRDISSIVRVVRGWYN